MCAIRERGFKLLLFSSLLVHSKTQWRHLVLSQIDEHAKNRVNNTKNFLRATAGSKMMSDIKVTNHVTCFHLPFGMLQSKYVTR